jgi:aspartate/methionine/tyrosine aminotransferase
MDYERLLAERTRKVEFSGIRKFFDFASRLKDPCDFSIGLPDYDAPAELKEAACAAIRVGVNRYTTSAGLPELRDRLAADIKRDHGVDTSVMITSGVSGGLFLAMLSVVNPGDEVIFLDPYFISYLQLTNMIGGVAVPVPSQPDFRFNPEKIRAAITKRTKALLINSPGNPTGRVMGQDETRAAAQIAREHNLLLISDEIYEKLCYDGRNPTPLVHAPQNTVILRGFGKTYGITGWRMGYAAGPREIIDQMTKLHQFTYVCAPSMAQQAILDVLDLDVSHFRKTYTAKRDLVCKLLAPAFDFVRPGGGFYVYPKVPAKFESGTAFATAAAEMNVLVIPGAIFSSQDTHFRISYAVSDDVIKRGCEILCRLAK